MFNYKVVVFDWEDSEEYLLCNKKFYSEELFDKLIMGVVNKFDTGKEVVDIHHVMGKVVSVLKSDYGFMDLEFIEFEIS